MNWENSTEQGRRSLIAAFILTLLIVGPLVLLNDSEDSLVGLMDGTAVPGQSAVRE